MGNWGVYIFKMLGWNTDECGKQVTSFSDKSSIGQKQLMAIIAALEAGQNYQSAA